MEKIRSLFVGAHPDDLDVLFGHAIAHNPDNRTLVLTRGEAGQNRLPDERFCPGGAADI